jgi:hypothetical protein
MSSDLSLQTPPKLAQQGADVSAASKEKSPDLVILMRQGTLALLVVFLDFKSILTLMSVRRLALVDKSLVLMELVRKFSDLIPELPRNAWSRRVVEVMMSVEFGRGVGMLRDAYNAFVHDQGPGMSKNLIEESSHFFLHEWMEEADPRTFGDLLRSGFFSSKKKRSVLLDVLERKEIDLIDRFIDLPATQNTLEQYNRRLHQSYVLLMDIAENSFCLDIMTVNGRAWGNTGMASVPKDDRLYVSVSKEYVDNLNATMSHVHLFKPFQYDLVSDRIWEDTKVCSHPPRSPPLTVRPWHGPQVPRLP